MVHIPKYAEHIMVWSLHLMEPELIGPFVDALNLNQLLSNINVDCQTGSRIFKMNRKSCAETLEVLLETI